MKTESQKRKLLHVISICLVVAGVLTIFPNKWASSASILGYNALCPFAPISTVVTLYIGVTMYRYLKNN